MLTCFSIVVFVGQIYNVRYSSTRAEPLAGADPRSVYVFTRIHRNPETTSPFGRHCKMLRRQYKRVIDKRTKGPTYVEYFLEANQIQHGEEWSATTFSDTIYVDSPLLSMLEMIAGNVPVMPTDSIFVYMNDGLFDLGDVSALQSIDQNQRGLFCLTGLEKNGTSCEHDYFAFNYETAKLMRWKFLMTRHLNEPGEFRESLETRVGLLSNWILSTSPFQKTSAISNFFALFEHKFIDKSYKLDKSSAINVELVHYNTPDDFAARVNGPTIDGLQPMFKASSPQPLVKYLLRPASCNTGSLTIFVKCARSDVFERDWIRSYTRRMAAIGNFTFDRVFLLGNSDKDDFSTTLVNEANTHGDILIGDFADTYDNLPIKTYLGFQYFANECRNKKYVVFQDSDAFTMIDLLMEDFKLDEG